MHGKIKNILKKTALLLILGLICITVAPIGKPQEVQAADHIYKNKTFHVYAEHAVMIQSYFSDDNINQSKLPNWNNRGYGTITIISKGQVNHNGGSYYDYEVVMSNVDVKNKTPYLYILAPKNLSEGYYPVSARITASNNDNGCNVKANEYKQLEETLDASNKLFAYIGYSFTGTEMEVRFDQYKFNVTYDLNGGQGTNSTQEGKFNRTKTGVTLHGAPSRTGYQFTGWKCNRDSKVYSAGSNYYPNDWKDGHLLYQITMTAQWEARKYYVTYDSNKPDNASHDVTGTMPKTEFQYDIEKNLDRNQYSLTGWTFEGWNTKADGSGDSYTDSKPVTNLGNGKDITLYAQWIPNSYQIIFNKQAGENGTNSMYEVYDTGFFENTDNVYKDKHYKNMDWVNKNKLTKIDNPSKVNYEFNGYFTEINRGGTEIINKDGSITCSANTFPNKTDTTSTVYAYWTPATYRIILDDNGGKGGSGAIYEWYGKGYYWDENHQWGANSVNIPKRKGYKFGGYWTSKNNVLTENDKPMTQSTYQYLVNGTSKIGDDGSLADLSNTDFSKNTKLYALWLPEEFTITLSSEDADIAHGTPKYTEIYGYFNYADIPKVYENGTYRTDTASNGFTGNWETFTAPYTGEYTFTDDNGYSQTLTLKQGESVKIYNNSLW